MASRSIDFAKTASIDMMTLNNKVVNMRQVVRRTKVHVISKLCKHINSLKKKKGTDEQKAKNLRKAQRFIEEIDSMKKLKEDKISKYALANTASFNDTSKISLSSGPRALARLADHPLMKKVVTDFREQHIDWRDLTAYLLIKQTGRRFKTKKQKQKKLAKCVENIQASETMTKAYIKERFGLDGLAKAELRFERKRKRPKSTVISGSTDTVNADSKRQRSCSGSDKNSVEDLVQNQIEKLKSEKDKASFTNNENSVVEGKTIIGVNTNKIEAENIVKHELTEGKICCEVSGESDEDEAGDSFGGEAGESDGDEADESDGDEAEVAALASNQSVRVKKDKIQWQHDESEDSSSLESETDNTQDSQTKADTHIISENHASNVEQNPVRTSEGKIKLKSECVVKELRLGSSSGDDSDDPSSSESEEDVQSTNSGDQSVEDDEDIDTLKVIKSKKKKEKPVPELLMKANKTQSSDPFFAGSDDDGEVNVNDGMYNSDHNVSGDEYSPDNYKASSMFYNPNSEGTYAGRPQWSQRGAGRGGFVRRGPPGKFDKGQRGRGFRNDGRGRGASFVGAGREGNVRKFTSQQSYNKHDSKNTAKQSFTADRFSRKNIAEQEKSHQTHADVASDKMPKEKLHPSWEASKKRKAEQSSLKAFKGSKITFDDDD